MKRLILAYVISILCIVGGHANAFANTGENSVLQTLEGYMIALQTTDREKAMPYYSAGTAKMMKNRPFSAGMMINEFRALEACGDAGRAIVKESFAVIRFPDEKRQCSPYFLVKQKGEWRLDFETMMQVVRFDASNQWWIDPKVSHPYSFAF